MKGHTVQLFKHEYTLREEIAGLFLSMLAFLPTCCIAASEESQEPDHSLLPLKIAFLASLGLAIYGLYASRKKKIVVFANLTDIAVTVAVPIVGVLCLLLGNFLEMRGVLLLAAVSIPVLINLVLICKATFLYNIEIGADFWGFLLAFFTKLFFLALYLLLAALILCSGQKRKGESEAAFERRVQRQNRAAFLTLNVIFGFLAFLGLWDRNFVSLKDYCAGKWGRALPA